jgi:N-carbamoyl-L-amino-acid hydrolase
VIIAVNELATENPGRQVGTVGQISVKPGASNVVPGTAVLSVEFRDLDAEKIATLMTGAKARGEAIAAATGTRFSYRNPQILKPYITDSRVRAAVDEAAERLGYSRKQMPSGAGHDAQKIGLVAPAGMIFIPSAGGISHSPNEYTPPDDIGRGANVLLHALLDLDQKDFVNEAEPSGGKNKR